jgi:acetylglutamate kinase
MVKENPRFFWRARIDNEVNPWYFARSDGAFKNEKWVVFWCGIEGFADIQRCVDIALAMPATLKALPGVGA